MNRYFLAIADRNHRWHLILSLVAIMGSLGAATTLLAANHEAWRVPSALLFFVVSASTALMIVWDFSRKAQIARTAAEQLNEVDVELRRLWHSVDLPDGQADVIKDIERLEGRIDAVTRLDIPTDQTLNEQCNTEAWEAIKSFYPSRTGQTHQDRA